MDGDSVSPDMTFLLSVRAMNNSPFLFFFTSTNVVTGLAILLVDFLHVVVHQARDSHFAAAFVAESSRDFKSILLFPDGPVDFDFLQGVVCFSAAFCAEVLLILQGGTLPSVFTSLSIIVFLSLFFVNKKPLTVCRSQNPSVGFMSLQIP